jgi:hypothetical protein
VAGPLTPLALNIQCVPQHVQTQNEITLFIVMLAACHLQLGGRKEGREGRLGGRMQYGRDKNRGTPIDVPGSLFTDHSVVYGGATACRHWWIET